MPAKICPLYKAASMALPPVTHKAGGGSALAGMLRKPPSIECDGERCAWFAEGECAVQQNPSKLTDIAAKIAKK